MKYSTISKLHYSVCKIKLAVYSTIYKINGGVVPREEECSVRHGARWCPPVSATPRVRQATLPAVPYRATNHDGRTITHSHRNPAGLVLHINAAPGRASPRIGCLMSEWGPRESVRETKTWCTLSFCFPVSLAEVHADTEDNLWMVADPTSPIYDSQWKKTSQNFPDDIK